MANHPIVHVDIPAQDPAAAAKFYETALGWKLTHDPNFDYWMFSTDGGPGGGFVSLTGEMHAEVGKPVIHFGSEDIDADLARVEAAGGRIIMPQTPIPGIGAFAIFADPTGNQFSFYKGITPTA